MNKCDAAVQEISRNNKNISKEPAQIKTYSRKAMDRAAKSRQITRSTCTNRAGNGKEMQDHGGDVEVGEQDSGKFATNEILPSGQEEVKEIASTSFSSNSKVEKRTQAKEKCFGKQLKKRGLQKTTSIVPQHGDNEKKGGIDCQPTENIDTLQFEAKYENSNVTDVDMDKDKENIGTECFTRLRPRGAGTSSSLMVMLNKEPSHEGSPKALKSTPKTRAQKRNFQGTLLRYSLKTLPQNEREASKDLTNERISCEQDLKKTKNAKATKETPMKPQG